MKLKVPFFSTDALRTLNRWGAELRSKVFVSSDELDDFKGELQQQSVWWGGVSTGAANKYIINLEPEISDLEIGQRVSFIAHQANTSSCTLTVNGIGPYSLKVFLSTGAADPIIRSSKVIEAVWDGTYWQVVDDGIDGDIEAIASLAGTEGILCKTAADTWALRTLTGTANQVAISNGDGAAGNPLFELPQDIATTSNVNFNKVTAADFRVSSGGNETMALTTTGLYMDNNFYLRFKNLAGTTDGQILTVDTGDRTVINSFGEIDFRSNGSNQWVKDSSGHFYPAVNSSYRIGVSGTNQVSIVYANTIRNSNAGVDLTLSSLNDIIMSAGGADVQMRTSGGGSTTSWTFSGTQLLPATRQNWTLNTYSTDRNIASSSGATLQELADCVSTLVNDLITLGLFQ